MICEKYAELENERKNGGRDGRRNLEKKYLPNLSKVV